MEDKLEYFVFILMCLNPVVILMLFNLLVFEILMKLHSLFLSPFVSFVQELLRR